LGTTIAASALVGAAAQQATPPPTSAAASTSPVEKIRPYQARFNRRRPVVAVVGQNSTGSTTELTDFLIPYGILSQSGATETLALATQPGWLNLRPRLRLQPQATLTQFDARFAEGADYVIVPAVTNIADPVLLTWIKAQAAKGATVVSICDGALVVANTGLLKGHRATAHWDTQGLRAEKYSDTQWLQNVRYVADGPVVSSAGISAAIPVSLALVEAIAGTERAAALAGELGVADWGPQHNSEVFLPQFGVNLMAFATTHFTNDWFHSTDHIGVPVAAGVDDIKLALIVDAYSRTGRSQAYVLAPSAEPLRTRHGLLIAPDQVAGQAEAITWTLPAFDNTPSAQMLDQALAGIAHRYGRQTAYGVALDFEYPGFRK
jgi:putative intracellular protease/amidase